MSKLLIYSEHYIVYIVQNMIFVGWCAHSFIQLLRLHCNACSLLVFIFYPFNSNCCLKKSPIFVCMYAHQHNSILEKCERTIIYSRSPILNIDCYACVKVLILAAELHKFGG
jgi:hypothetical protein